MRNKLCVIVTYFGTFHPSIVPFIQSCERNPEFDWLFFTDCQYKNLPSNVHFYNMTLAKLKNLIEKKLGDRIVLDRPYKMCDYRPAYGVIFEDYLNKYDFWGYGDVDVVYGCLSNFITDELCDQYDKIYPCGHLSFVRNKSEINNIYKRAIKGTLDYKTVFADNKPYIFDEYQGINEKLLKHGYRVYGQIEFADIAVRYKNRFRVADKNTIRLTFPKYPFKKNMPRNYKKQIFMVESGRAYRVYVKNKKICKEEVAYIHYRYKIPCEVIINQYTDYYVTNTGFVIKTSAVSEQIIDTLNPYPGAMIEFKESLAADRNAIISLIGKNKKIRNFIRMFKGLDKV